MTCKDKPNIPQCSLIAKTYKKTQIPLYDAFGPFPDEPLMTGIDRVLFLFGARKLLKSPIRECPTIEEDVRSEIFLDKEKQIDYSSGGCSVRDGSTYSVIQKSRSPKPDVDSNGTSYRRPLFTPRINGNNYSGSQNSSKIGLPLRTLKRSFSLCSLACRRLREKMKFSLPLPQSTQYKPNIKSQWLWTKVDNYGDGCQVYEVFKNSSTAAHPTKFDTSQAAKIIFVILPNGIIMPFETLPCHC